MATTVQTVVAAARHLSPTEQLEVIQALTKILQQAYLQTNSRLPSLNQQIDIVPVPIRRAPPVTNFASFASDFWPDDETADDINSYLAQQHLADRERYLPNLDETIRPLFCSIQTSFYTL